MIIDSKGRLFGKISVVDIVIVVLVLGVIGGLGYKFALSGKTTAFSAKNTVRTTFRQNDANNYVPNEIKVGDLVKDNQTGSEFGKVVNITTDKSVVFGVNDQGQFVQSTKSNTVSIEVTVEGPGIYRDGVTEQGVNFGNIDYFVNKEVQLKIGNTQLWASIKHFEKKE